MFSVWFLDFQTDYTSLKAHPTSCVENQLTEMPIVLQDYKCLCFLPALFFKVLYGK